MTANDPVLDSLDRWRSEGLLDEPLHQALRARAEEEAGERRRRQAARFVTATGAVLLVAAFVVLTTIFWDDLTPALRAGSLWAITAAVGAYGVVRVRGDAVDRLGSALVGATMALSIGAMALTDDWLGRGHALVWTAAALSAIIIVALGAWKARSNPVLPVVAFGMVFAYVPYVGRILDVTQPDPVLVALGTVAGAVLLALSALFLLRPVGDHGLAPGTLDGTYWVAFVAAFPLVPMLWFDVIHPFDGFDNWGPILTYAALAAIAVLVGARTGRNGILVLGSVMAVVDAWYVGVVKGEAFGTVVALLASALILFWLGHRLGLVGRAHRTERPA